VDGRARTELKACRDNAAFTFKCSSISRLRDQSLIALKRRGMSRFSDIGFDLIARQKFIDLGTRIDMKLDFFIVMILDPVKLPISPHERAFDRVLGQAFRQRRSRFLIRHRIGGSNIPGSESQGCYRQ
jgi:hypothetical protein